MNILAVTRGITMLESKSFLFFAFCFSLSQLVGVYSVATSNGSNETAQPRYLSVRIGVVLDLNSPMGTMANSCLSMALSDFYAVHSDYKTRLFLNAKNAKEELEVASAVVDLLKNDEVHGVVGPEWSTEATLVAQLGARAHVPVISFTTKGQSLSPAKNPYFVCTTPDDSYQARALADICQGFEWHEVVIFYEDSDYGNQFISKMKESDIRQAYMYPVSKTAKDARILQELKKSMKMQTRVFLVHMNNSLGCRLFLLASKAGMMSEGYAWLITDSLSNFLNSLDSTCTDSMDGVLGIRPHVPKSKDLDNFKTRWKMYAFLRKPEMGMELNIYGLWAYDTIWALAMATEKILSRDSDLIKFSQNVNGTGISNLRVSQFGPKLLSELLHTKFKGLSGEFQLVDWKMQPPAFEIFNVIGTGDRTVGYWIPDRGISQNLTATGESTYSTSTKELKAITWPGDSKEQPKGWAIIPSTGKLKVGVPQIDGFNEFVNVHIDPSTEKDKFSGFSIDVFLASLPLLPFKLDYEFIAYKNACRTCNGSYNDMLQKIKDKTYDIVVADTTIMAARATYVDFTLPYTESGVIMVVKNRKGIDMWTFLRPLRWDLCLTTAIACIFISVVVRMLEYRTNNTITGSMTPHRQELGLFFWFPVAAIAFPERNMVANKWSSFVLVIWLFVAYILMQSYTAKLSAIFTVDQLQFVFSKDYYVGYHHGSFVKDILINDLHFNESKLKSYSKIEEYHDAMSQGSKNGGIDAIFDEIPYMKLFINRYGSQYRMVGPTYKTDGFGFAFSFDSPLVIYFSRAILNVTQGANMSAIEQRNFGPAYLSDQDSINHDNPSLTTYDFGGLFIILGSATILALFCSETPVGQKLTSFLISNGKESRVHSKNHRDDPGSESSSEEVNNTEDNNAIELVRPGEVHEYENSNADVSATQDEIHESNH